MINFIILTFCFIQFKIFFSSGFHYINYKENICYLNIYMPSKNDVIYDFSENIKKVSLLTGLSIIVVIIVFFLPIISTLFVTIGKTEKALSNTFDRKGNRKK